MASSGPSADVSIYQKTELSREGCTAFVSWREEAVVEQPGAVTVTISGHREMGKCQWLL